MKFCSLLKFMWISVVCFFHFRKMKPKTEHSLNYNLIYMIYFVISVINGGKWELGML